MRRDDGENDRLRALVNGESFGSFGSDAEIEARAEPMERAPSGAVSAPPAG